LPTRGTGDAACCNALHGVAACRSALQPCSSRVAARTALPTADHSCRRAGSCARRAPRRSAPVSYAVCCTWQRKGELDRLSDVVCCTWQRKGELDRLSDVVCCTWQGNASSIDPLMLYVACCKGKASSIDSLILYVACCKGKASSTALRTSFAAQGGPFVVGTHTRPWSHTGSPVQRSKMHT
jgi:hypothetical protein